MTVTLSEKLKQGTKQNHQQLEKLVVAHLRPISSPEEYIKVLQMFSGYFGALEDKIKKYISNSQLPDYAGRRKTESIANDIKIMGGTVPAKAKENELPEIKNYLQAFGALYVIEGSTLGGKIISQMVAKQLNLTDSNALSFFSGYGNETDRMWASFKEVLDSNFQNPEEEKIITDTANETFLKFKQWIEKFVNTN